MTKSDKYVASLNVSIYCMSPPTWNEEFELPDGSYSVSDIQDYFEYIFKKDETNAYNPSIKIYVNKKGNRITFAWKKWNYLETLKVR